MAIIIEKSKYPSFAASVGQSGKRWLIYLNYGVNATGQNPVWTMLGGIVSNSVNFKADVTTNNTKDTGLWQEGVVTSKSGEVSAEVTFKADNVAQAAIEEFMINDEITNEKKMLDIAVVNLDESEYFRLKIVPSAWNLVANSGDMVTKSLTATINGKPEYHTGWLNPDENGVQPSGIVVFDKDHAEDKTFSVSLADGVTVTAIKNGNTALTSGTDYNLASGTLVIKSSYLAARDNGIVTLTVACSGGNNPELTFAVTGTGE